MISSDFELLLHQIKKLAPDTQAFADITETLKAIHTAQLETNQHLAAIKADLPAVITLLKTVDTNLSLLFPETDKKK